MLRNLGQDSWSLSGTSTREAPWHVVPAYDKLPARLFMSHIILETLEKLNMAFPEMKSERRKELQAMRKQLKASRALGGGPQRCRRQAYVQREHLGNHQTLFRISSSNV